MQVKPCEHYAARQESHCQQTVDEHRPIETVGQYTFVGALQPFEETVLCTLESGPFVFSAFLNEAERYINGEITLDDLDELIDSYYKNNPEQANDRRVEADKVSVKIGNILSENSFTFTVGQLCTIHERLFEGVLKHPGELRTYNFTKNEWVLDGASVTYGDYRELSATLRFDFEQEKNFDYKGLSIDDVINHLAIFVSNLWQIHAFEEGNTRTTAVFFIKYLRTLGFNVNNDLFAEHSQYFRNALVRANYTNIMEGIFEDRSFLIKFLRTLLLNEKNILKNRDLRIHKKSGEAQKEQDPRILSLIKENPNITTEELASSLEVSVRTVKNLTRKLTEDGIIKRMNGKRYGYWVVKK